MTKKLTKEEFIEKANIIHNNIYDYSKVIYINNRIKIIITCFIHGDFEQSPANHLFSQGCPKCGIERAKYLQSSNTQEFITKANAVHNNKFDYSKVNYINGNTKVIIICTEHGDFLQIAGSHLSGNGCPKCYYNKIGNRTRSNTEEFITKARKVHNDIYKYSKVVYIHCENKIKIDCLEHGEFEQTPIAHLRGQGCPKCRNEKLNLERRLTLEEFIVKAKEIHGDRYDYSLVNYVNMFTKITIKCKDHDEFQQTPDNHLRGQGCPSCNRSKGEIAIEYILKKHNIHYQPEYKISEVVNEFEYDFYLSDYNLLIEFHGIQHFKAIEFFGGEAALDYTRRNDEIKKYHAYRFKYRFIEFNYLQFKQLSKEQFEKLVINKITL